MKKEQTNQSLYSEELEQLNFDQAEQEARELFEQDKLPSPFELEKYNQLIPNGAERILNIIEDERIHRREMERKELKKRSNTNNLRIIFGFLFGFFFLIFVNISGSGVSYLLVWAAMIVMLVMVFAPYLKDKLVKTDESK